jgi:hypothetical protein
MNAQFDYDGRVHTFRVSIGPRPDGKIGPPAEVIVEGPEQRQCAPRRRSRWRVAYDRVDAEHDRLLYRVIEVL